MAFALGLVLILLGMVNNIPSIPGLDQFAIDLTGDQTFAIRKFEYSYLYPLAFVLMMVTVALHHAFARTYGRWGLAVDVALVVMAVAVALTYLIEIDAVCLIDQFTGERAALIADSLKAEQEFAELYGLPIPDTVDDPQCLNTTGVWIFAIVGGAIAAAETDGEPKKMVRDITTELSDVKPAEMFAKTLNRRLESFNMEDRSLDSIGANNFDVITTTGPPLGYDASIMMANPDSLETQTLNKAIETGGNTPVLGVSLSKIGLYPIIEDDVWYYSFASIAEAVLAVPNFNRAGAARDVALVNNEYAVIKRRFPIITAPRLEEERTTGGAQLFEQEMKDAFDTMAERIIDYMYRISREDHEVITTAEGYQSMASPYRVKPTFPGEDRYSFGDDLAWALNPFDFREIPSNASEQQNNCKAVNVGTTRPTFRWNQEPVTENGGRIRIANESLKYDLRVFDDGFREVYRVDDIKGSQHAIEKALDANKIHYWTVRANFIQKGKKRVTDWAICGQGVTEFPFMDDEPVHEYFPFKT